MEAIITVIESVYLLYMFVFFKTKYSLGAAAFDKATQALGPLFVHDTGQYENKVCLFGKVLACVAVIVWSLRGIMRGRTVAAATLIFDALCLLLAYAMNLNAFVYILPLVFSELYLTWSTYKIDAHNRDALL